MKLNKTNIIVETLGDFEIFSYNGYILALKNFPSTMSFFPLVINTKNYNKEDLNMYFNFIDFGYEYNDGNPTDGEEEDIYFRHKYEYDACFRDHNKVYRRVNQEEIEELIEKSDNCEVYIEPYNLCLLNSLIHELMFSISLSDKSFTKNLDRDNVKTIHTLFLDDNNYIEIKIDDFNRYSMTYNSTLEKMDDVVEIFKYVFSMVDKNLGNKRS